MEIEHIVDAIDTGTVIAILDNKISSKAKGEKYFSGRWLINNIAVEKAWDKLIEDISKIYEIEIIDKNYPAIGRKRKELTVGIRR